MKRSKKIITLIILIIINLNASSQDIIKFTPHKIQKQYFDKLKKENPKEYFKFGQSKKILSKNNSKDCNLEKIVFGWYPYWAGETYLNYRWNMLSDLSFFSYEVDYTNGDAITTHNFETANVVDIAQANGTRVNLCVTMFDDFQTFFNNVSAQQNLIDNLLTLVQNRNANGINIDFEGVPEAQKIKFKDFLINLATKFHNEIPNSQVSIAIPAVDWANVFDISALKNYIDLFIIMGYDYYWTSGGVDDIAGPTGQLYTMYNFNYNQSRSVIYYLNEGVPHNKLCLGVPYYGFDWKTNDANVPTQVVEDGQPIFIKTIKQNSNEYYSNKNIEDSSLCAYYNYNNGNYHQAWIDDEETLKYKYDIVLKQGIAGVGIWALGYDDGYSEMWDLIENKLSTCASVPDNYEAFDMGGPLRKHYNNEDYTYTISPTNYVSNLVLEFSEFELEAGYDSLWIYDGVNINAPLIGGYSGTTNPGIIYASGASLTLKFHSDGATVKKGWNANWTCNTSNTKENVIKKIKLYPNPAKEFVYVNSNELPNYIKVYSLKGKLLTEVNNSYYINVSDLKNACYLFEIEINNTNYKSEIIIQH